jgi:outer membrane protein
MSTFYRSASLVAVALSGFMLSAPASAEIKLGVVNFQKLLEEAPQTKSAMQDLENEFAPRRRELMTMQNDLKARDEKMQKEGALMAEPDRQKAEKALRDEQREFSRKAGEFQDDASQRRNEELNKVQRYIAGEINVYSAAQGFDLVLGESFFVKPTFDITAQVLEVLKTKPVKLPASSAAPGAAPGAAAPAAKPPAKPPGTK